MNLSYHRRVFLGCTLKDLTLISAFGTVTMSIMVLAASVAACNYKVFQDTTVQKLIHHCNESCDWESYLAVLSLVALIVTILLIWGLYNDSQMCIIIWLVIFLLLFFITVIMEAQMIFSATQHIDIDFILGKCVFMFVIDVFIYLQLVLYSNYRNVLKAISQTSTITLNVVNGN